MKNLLVVSATPEDKKIGENLSQLLGLKLRVFISRDDIRTFLSNNQQTLVLWDAEDPSSYGMAGETLQRMIPPRQLVAVTDKPVWTYPQLLEHQSFNHHLIRKTDPTSLKYYAQLLQGATLPNLPSGLAFFFPPTTPIKQLPITNSTHKRAATEAIQKYLNQLGILSRISTFATQAIDELIMNAIFDAPVNTLGRHVRWEDDRTASFEIPEDESVTVELGSCPEYVGVSVKDRFGSLLKSTLVNSLGQHFHRVQNSSDVSELEQGLGLRGIIKTRITLLHTIEIGKTTQAMIFFPRAAKFKEFRDGPQMVGMFTT